MWEWAALSNLMDHDRDETPTSKKQVVSVETISDPQTSTLMPGDSDALV
jgi:hypothetical protein